MITTSKAAVGSAPKDLRVLEATRHSLVRLGMCYVLMYKERGLAADYDRERLLSTSCTTGIAIPFSFSCMTIISVVLNGNPGDSP